MDFEQFDGWSEEDAQVKNWSEHFFGPHDWNKDEEWSEWSITPHVSYRKHDDVLGTYEGRIELEWHIDLDALLYFSLPDPDSRVTNLLAHFINTERDGDWDDIDLFQAWYEMETGYVKQFQDKLHSEIDWEVRRKLIMDRLAFAFKNYGSELRGPSEQVDKIVRWLEEAYDSLIDNPDTVFEVNGFRSSCPDPFGMYLPLRIMHSYACGEAFTVKDVLAEGEELASNNYGDWGIDSAVPVTDQALHSVTTGETYRLSQSLPESNQRVMGYILKICDNRVKSTLEGNAKKNAQVLAQAREKQVQRGLIKRGSYERLGANHDHHLPFHSGSIEFFQFEIDGMPYAAFPGLETPSGKVPVFEWNYEWSQQPIDELHASANIYCRHCGMYWDFEEGVFLNENHYRKPTYNLNAMPFIELTELPLTEEDDEGVPISERQVRMFADEALYKEAHYIETPKVIFMDGVVTVDDDNNMYCPECHNRLRMSCGIDTL